MGSLITHVGVGFVCMVIGGGLASNVANTNTDQLVGEFDLLISKILNDHKIEMNAAKAKYSRLEGLNEGLRVALNSARQQPVGIKQESETEKKHPAIVKGGTKDFLDALREEADLLMEVADNNTSKKHRAWKYRLDSIGHALSRVHNRVVNDCEYVAYKTGEESDGEIWGIRRVDLACTY